MFDFNFSTLMFSNIKRFSSLSTHPTEIKQSDSERGLHPQCHNVETFLN